ncbi:MAG TPA: hypothetical protein VFC18_17165 [Burkholderiales bacterium]|nr:hypothetical protein [Burkholderiales bacterium]
MEALIRARPYVIAVFFVALGAAFVSTFANSAWLLKPAGVLAQIALFLFLTTESFGRIAQSRSGTSRWAARVFFALSALVVGTLAAGFMLDLLA